MDSTVQFYFMMDLRRLHVLRVVDQLGTVTAAARALHLTPSAVSQQLRGLATDLDLPLLEPDGRRVRLTTAAHALLRHADDLSTRWERAYGEISNQVPQVGGTLQLGGFSSSVDIVLAPATVALRDTEPALTVHVHEVDSANALEKLLVGTLDIAVVLPRLGGPPGEHPRFEQRVLLDEPHDLLVSREHALSGHTDVALEDAADEPWVLAPPGSCDQYEITSVMCAAAGFSPRIAHEAIEWLAVAALVARGLGVCLMPRYVPVPAGYDVVRLPLRGPTAPRRRVLACVRRGTSEQWTIAAGLAALHDAARARSAGNP